MISGFEIAENYLIGLIAAFSPCLFPLFPSYVAVVTKSGFSKVKSVGSSLFLMIGVLIVFLTLTFLTNKTFQAFLIKNYVNLASLQAILLVLAGILMLRPPVFLSKIQIPQKFYDMISDDNEEVNPYKAGFLLGLLYTIIAAPCAGGYFLLFWSNIIGLTLINQLILVVMFSVGAGTPFLVASIVMPQLGYDFNMRFQDAAHKISLILGVMLVIVGIWLYSSVNY